ncbi:nucleoside/nucleotide kinase family protein [Kushneria phyllosphaerae]|uniref:Pantothenate kinase n=1 Tax=Kushneria phyllosphaerae TaxID=2100822 RepID=A0A2R8CMI4_9GAMM|nr:nucleoside/nucleotide kinase family protein [Kushneria phyllosphaerae]SPJ34059.1 Pantothenate kinase [Kushneria phyllosphaerae]
MTTSENDIADLMIDEAVVNAAQALIKARPRALLGLVGAPGAGKSSVSEALLSRLGEAMQVVPMDGYHLSNRELARLGRAARKGAPDTFDSAGYVSLLERLRTPETDETVYAPGFYRQIEEPIAASIAVSPQTSLVVTEGNYLLMEETPWDRVRPLLDEVWYVEVDTQLREQWLVERHMRFGRSEADAKAWVASTDRPNAERIEATRVRADRRIGWDGACIRFL